MGKTKKKLQQGETALGAWIMVGHPTVAEIFAGEGFDWICVDMEHTASDVRAFHQVALATKGTNVDLFVRLPSCDPVAAKIALDIGANGIIVPSVNTPEEAAMAVSMAKYPPEGQRGSALCRASDYGRNFKDYFHRHNDEVLVVVMLEDIKAVENVDAILATPGIDATFIGPYDLSASMGMPGNLTHPEVLAAQETILQACRCHQVPAGIHVVAVDPDQVQLRIDEGFRFIACGLDTQFLMFGARHIAQGHFQRNPIASHLNRPENQCHSQTQNAIGPCDSFSGITSMSTTLRFVAIGARLKRTTLDVRTAIRMIRFWRGNVIQTKAGHCRRKYLAWPN